MCAIIQQDEEIWRSSLSVCEGAVYNVYHGKMCFLFVGFGLTQADAEACQSRQTHGGFSFGYVQGRAGMLQSNIFQLEGLVNAICASCPPCSARPTLTLGSLGLQ